MLSLNIPFLENYFKSSEDSRKLENEQHYLLPVRYSSFGLPSPAPLFTILNCDKDLSVQRKKEKVGWGGELFS